MSEYNETANISSFVSPLSDVSSTILTILRVVTGIFLVFYCYILVVIIRSLKFLKNNMYYILLNLAIPDISALILHTTRIFHVKFFRQCPLCLFTLFIDQLIWYLALYSVFILAINRVVAVIFWKHYEKVDFLVSSYEHIRNGGFRYFGNVTLL